MSTITDIFNSTFFVCLGLIILACAGIILYFESKIREQNHKFTSMISLISSMAEELNYIKAIGFSSYRGGETNIVQPTNTYMDAVTNNNDENLIKVSDGEDTDSDDDDENDSMNDDSSSESDSDENNSDDGSEKKNIKLLKLSSHQDNIVITENKKDNIEVLDLEDMDELYKSDDEDNTDKDEDEGTHSDDMEDLEDNDNDDDNSSDDNDAIPKLDFDSLENDIEAEAEEFDFSKIVKQEPDTEESTLPNLKEAVSESLKKINILNLEEDHEQNDFLDYKKCSVPKLRSIVVEKGLVTDASKLKKAELLTLLGASE
jgi:hypothetical protein